MRCKLTGLTETRAARSWCGESGEAQAACRKPGNARRARLSAGARPPDRLVGGGGAGAAGARRRMQPLQKRCSHGRLMMRAPRQKPSMQMWHSCAASAWPAGACTPARARHAPAHLALAWPGSRSGSKRGCSQHPPASLFHSPAHLTPVAEAMSGCPRCAPERHADAHGPALTF